MPKIIDGNKQILTSGYGTGLTQKQKDANDRQKEIFTDGQVIKDGGGDTRISFTDAGPTIIAGGDLTVNGVVTTTSATGTAAGGGIDAVSPSVNVSQIGRDIVTEVFIDIGAGLILSSGGEGDVIGEDGVANAFVTKMTTAINGMVYAGEIVCLEVPTTGDPDVNVVAHATGTLAEDADGETGAHHVLANCGVHTLALKTAFTIPSGGIQNDFIYLTHGGATAGTYDAGIFLLRFFGTPIV